jgi:hypothetical protein
LEIVAIRVPLVERAAEVVRLGHELLSIAIVAAATVIASIPLQLGRAALQPFGRARQVAMCRHTARKTNRGERGDRQSDSLRHHYEPPLTIRY